MSRTLLRILIIVPIAALLGVVFGLGTGSLFRGGLSGGTGLRYTNTQQETGEIPAQIETVFLALDTATLDEPVEVSRPGSGGALTSVGDTLVLMSMDGLFWDVTGNSARKLQIAAPPNGWDAMLAFAEAHPDYTFGNYFFRYNDVDYRDGRLYVAYTDWNPDADCYRTSLASVALDNADQRIAPDDWRVFFSTSPCLPPKTEGRAIDGHMAGSRFRVGEDGRIYLASGDYAVDGTYAPIAIAQDPAMQYGKVLAIDSETGASETLSQGHSNMQGITFDGEGRLWAVEHGRRGGDELNLIRKGLDYGWPSVSLGTRYNRLPLPGVEVYGRHTGYEPPVFAWLPSVATSALTRIEGFDPAWDGDLLAGTLAGQMLIRIRIRDGRVLFAERIPVGQRIRYVHQHGDAIALWTDSKQVVRLTPGRFDLSQQFAMRKVETLEISKKQKAETRLVLERCAECHGFGMLSGDAAPPLGLVADGAVAAHPGFAYSDALRGVGGTWTRERLVAYLDDPAGFAGQTDMPDPEIDDPVVLGAVADVLDALRHQAE